VPSLTPSRPAPLILALDTSSSLGSVALARGGTLLESRAFEADHGHSQRLLPAIEGVFVDAGLGAGEVDLFAVVVGPGSFTGLRIGLSIAKGLVLATGVPLVAVPTLEALAWRTVRAGKTDRLVLAAIDARRDEVYCQLFEASGEELRPLWEPRDLAVDRLVEELGGRTVLVTGDGRAKVMARAAGGAVRCEQADAGAALCSAAGFGCSAGG